MAVLTLVASFFVGGVLTLATLLAAWRFLPKQPNFTGKSIPTASGIVLLPAMLTAIFYAASDGYLPFALYLLVAVIAGFVDDVRGDGGARGFRGHLGALLAGRVTTGMFKIVALGGGAVLVGVLEFGFGGFGIVALSAGFIVAGWANLGNLFDLRPGRAVKFTALAFLCVIPFASYAGVGSMLPVLGGILALFYFDLRGRIMLGDAGAAVCGSVVGLAVVSSGSPVVWTVAGLVVAVLTVVAEFSSISRMIEEVRVLRWLDLWGRVRDRQGE